ncbi:MAG: autotransporter-associated beta strand repeat-containing protein [Kiritimatiellae bacterium]|nr:autotransporter-associated beta strand repeat-containing protein [Kiritimatiellia bacterium]
MNDAVACDRSLVLFNTTNGMVSCPVAAFDIDGMADVRSTGTAWSLNALRMGNKNNGGTPRFEVLGGTVTATNDNVIGVSDNAELVVNGGTFRALRYFNVGQNAGATGIVTVASGMFDNCYLAAETPTGISTVFYLGKSQKNSYGILNVTGGEMRLLSLYAGWIGHGEINVSGGKLYLRSDLRLAARSVDNADSVEDVFTVSGGEVECGFSGAAKIGFYSPNHARLKLDGGTFTCSGLQGGNAATAAGGAGWVALEADGGTIAARANNTEFLSKFDEAVINAGGLTIDTRGYAVTIKQNLTGTGMLTLAGGGSVTFDSGVTCGVKVRVVGGTTVDFGGVSPAGLVLGDGTTAGKIKLTLDSTVAVNGDLVINNIGFDLSGSLVKDTDYAPFITCTGTFDAASKEKWEDAMLSDVISPTETTVFAWTTDAGVTQLTIKSIDKVVHLIEVKEGTSNITDSVVSRTTENVEVAVSNAAVCNISGKVAKGRLIKTGTGKLELSSGDNIFLGGFDLVNGVLTLGAAGAFGDGTATQASVFRAGTFEVSAAAGPMTLANASTLAPDPATNGIIFKTEGDLTMPIPLASSAGAIIKRGAGRLVFTCDWDNSKTIGWSRGHVPAATLYNFPRYQTSIGFDAANGAIPEGAMYGTIVVVEGELVFRGTGSATRIDCSSSPVFVGYPTADHTSDFAQPTLVLDNVYGNFGGGSTDFRVGDCFTTANPWVTEPKILVTNNATLYVNTLYLTGTWADNTAAAAKLIVDGATVSAYYRFNPHNSSFTGVTPKGYFSNGAKLLTPFVELHKNCEMYFTNSVMAAEYTSGTYAFSTMSHYEDQPSRWTFVAGSTLYLNSITRKSSNTGSTATELRFDDAEWIPATGDYDFNADLKVSETLVDPAVKIVSLGTGLVLAPPADATWTMCKLEGEGGFVKRGEGTVTFNGTNAQFLGVTKVASGTLDLDASVWTNAKICGGAGMIANGTLSQPTIALCVSEAAGAWSADGVPHFGSTCSLNGRTKVDVGGVAIPIGKSLIVANYSGSAPDVSAWKLIGVPDSGGAFTAMGGQITMTVVDTAGFILLVK